MRSGQGGSRYRENPLCFSFHTRRCLVLRIFLPLFKCAFIIYEPCFLPSHVICFDTWRACHVLRHTRERQDVTVYNCKRQVICLYISRKLTCCSRSEGSLDIVHLSALCLALDKYASRRKLHNSRNALSWCTQPSCVTMWPTGPMLYVVKDISRFVELDEKGKSWIPHTFMLMNKDCITAMVMLLQNKGHWLGTHQSFFVCSPF